jgi:hypothetical protein
MLALSFVSIVIPAYAGIQASHVCRLLSDLFRTEAPTSDSVESLDFVGPNPLPCVGEGIASVILATAYSSA